MFYAAIGCQLPSAFKIVGLDTFISGKVASQFFIQVVGKIQNEL